MMAMEITRCRQGATNHSRPWRCNWQLRCAIGGTYGHVPVVVLVSCLLFICILACTAAHSTHLFRIGTGGTTGVYYPVGKVIAHGLTLYAQTGNADCSDYIGVAQSSAGSIENIRGIISSELEAGLVQADIATSAFTGTNIFREDVNSAKVRAIASLYPEKFQIVVRRDAGIGSVKELKGKRISMDEQGSGTLSVMRIVLAAYQMTEQDLLPVYLKPVFIHDQVVSGKLQGFVMMAGAPMAAVTSLYQAGVTLVPIAPAIATEINAQHPYLVPGTIAAEVYPGIPETLTIEVYALLVVSEDMSDDVAYAVTSSLFSRQTQQLLQDGHPLGSSITLDSALKGISIPLHPGAERFYRERNLLRHQ